MMAHSSMPSAAVVDQETDALLKGLSPSDIASLEKEFESLCDFTSNDGKSLEPKEDSRKLTVVDNKVGRKGKVISLSSNNNAISNHPRSSHSNYSVRDDWKRSENGKSVDGKSTTGSRYRYGLDESSTDPVTGSRSSRRPVTHIRETAASTYRNSASSANKPAKDLPNLDLAISACDSKTRDRRMERDRETLAKDQSTSLRKSSHSGEERRSKLNAPDPDETVGRTTSHRLTRRRISRESDEETRPRLTRNRLGSIDDGSADVQRSKSALVSETKSNDKAIREAVAPGSGHRLEKRQSSVSSRPEANKVTPEREITPLRRTIRSTVSDRCKSADIERQRSPHRSPIRSDRDAYQTRRQRRIAERQAEEKRQAAAEEERKAMIATRQEKLEDWKQLKKATAAMIDSSDEQRDRDVSESSRVHPARTVEKKPMMRTLAKQSAVEKVTDSSGEERHRSVGSRPSSEEKQIYSRKSEERKPVDTSVKDDKYLGHNARRSQRGLRVSDERDEKCYKKPVTKTIQDFKSQDKGSDSSGDEKPSRLARRIEQKKVSNRAVTEIKDREFGITEIKDKEVGVIEIKDKEFGTTKIKDEEVGSMEVKDKKSGCDIPVKKSPEKISDSSGDEKRSIRLIRRGDTTESVRPSRVSDSSSDEQRKRYRRHYTEPIVLSTPRVTKSDPSGEERTRPTLRRISAQETEKLIRNQEAPSEPKEVQAVESKIEVVDQEMAKTGRDEVDNQVADSRRASHDSGDRRLKKTDSGEQSAPFLTSFCVEYGGKTSAEDTRRASLQPEPVRRNKPIRRSGSLRTASDKCWIKDTTDDGRCAPRRDSYVRESSKGVLADLRRDSFTSEEKIVLRTSRRPSEDVPTDTVDAEISEVRAREGSRAEDDKTRLSLADKLKLFSDSPQEKKNVNRRKQRYKSQRFKTQPITFDEVEKAGKITPRPVSLVVTEKDVKTLQENLEMKNTGVEKGSKVEIPKDDATNFFAVDSKPVDIKVDSDAFDDIFLCSEDLLVSKRRVKPKRRQQKSANPLRALQQRDDIEDAYTEVKVVDVEKIKRQQIDNKTGFAEVALQGLASIENFNKVSLKKAKTVKKSTDPYSNLMLVLIKGRYDVQYRLVEPKYSSLSSGDSFVLISPEKIFCWLGKFCNIMEKAKAQEFANLIFKYKDMGFRGEKDVIVIEETVSDRRKDFWELLGGQGSYLTHETDDEVFEVHLCEMNIVYELKGKTLIPDRDWCSRTPKYEMLQDHSKVIVFDFGTELYVWNGPKCSFEDRKAGWTLAKQVWDNGVEYNEAPNPMQPFLEGKSTFKGPRPDWCIFGKINHNMETQLFKDKFFDWPDANKIITVKTEKKEEKEYVELKPCDVDKMITPNEEPVTILLEGSNVGRGRHWVDKIDDFMKKEFDVTTVKVTCWLVQEYDHHIMEFDSYGQFFDAETYVVRWQYMVTPAVRTLKGTQNRQSLAGRERCAYFFWQGKNSTVNEKGASALMTVELDDERGPHCRVVQGLEPPCFTQLFDGKMIVHLGKRGSEISGSWKLYIIRNEIDYEAYLLEVPCLYSSLRSRSSFWLLNLETGYNYIWHGAKSPQKTRDTIISVCNQQVKKYPSEIGMTTAIEDPVEIHEGNERRKFYLAFNDIDASYASLNKDLSFQTVNAPDYKMSPRLFHFTSVSGVFESVEILNPSRSEQISPLPFSQELLYDPCAQPALFLMDIGTKVYVWQGWWPDGFDEGENVQTGSASSRFYKERKLVLETGVEYCKRKEIQGELIVAGHESQKFTHLFPTWKVDHDVTAKNRVEYDRLENVFDIKLLLAQCGERFYTYEELMRKPEEIDHTKMETYLRDEEFEQVFRMTKSQFYELPAWKQIQLRKQAGLF